MLNWIRNHSGTLCIWSFAISAAFAMASTLSFSGSSSSPVVQIAMYVGGVGLLLILLLRIPYPYVKKRLPAELSKKAWVDMREEAFLTCGVFGTAGLLLSTLSAVIVSVVLGFILSVTAMTALLPSEAWEIKTTGFFLFKDLELT